MSAVVDLIRPEIRRLRPYRSAQFEAGMVRLNANETPWRPAGDTTADGLNRYPEPRPFTLATHLAAHYGVAPTQLLVTRGSSEAIDVLIRAFCRAGQDDIIICPPTFGMYEVYAQIQGAGIRAVPLLRNQGYALDMPALDRALDDRARLVFICSPNNPTGNRFPDADIERLAKAARGRAVVVLDAAYAEFAEHDPTLALLKGHENVFVLRTLSKAMGLAGVRCGVLLGAAPAVELLSCVLPPYCFPMLSVDAVENCLRPGNHAVFASRIALLKAERARLASTLQGLPGIVRVWPSEANFLLVEARDAPTLVEAARQGGVLVRDFSWDDRLPGCIRITVGDAAQNDQLLRAWGAS